MLDLGVDTTTAAGEFIAHVMAAHAQHEPRIIGQRTWDALAARRAAGVRLGRPAALSDDLVTCIVAARQAGQTFRAIADDLNARQVPTAQGAAKWWPATDRVVVRSQLAARLSAQR